MSKNNKVVWTDEILLFIIKHVKAAPFVWDHSHPQFAHKSKKAKFWSLLAEKVNAYGGFFSASPITKEALQKKWTNMKTYYLFEESKSRRIGTDAKNFSTPWKFRSTLSFLGSGADAATRSQQNTPGANTYCPVAYQPPSTGGNNLDLPENDPLSTQDCQTAQTSVKREEASIENSPVFNEFEIEEEDALPPSIKWRKESPTVEAQTYKKPQKSFFYHYGMTIAQDLDQLDEDFKIDAKLEIMQIIAKYKREQYLNKSKS